MIECPFQINNPKRAYLFLYLLTNKILFLTQLIILFNLPAKGDSEPIFKVFKWLLIPKAHICFYICSQIHVKYYLKIIYYLYYYFIILFLEFALFFSYSFPQFLYMWSIYMQPKYVTQSQFWLPFVLLDNEANPISQPHPTPLPFSTVTEDLQPHWKVWFFVSHLISFNTFVYLVSLNSWRSQRWMGGGTKYSTNGKQTKGVTKYKKLS